MYVIFKMFNCLAISVYISLLIIKWTIGNVKKNKKINNIAHVDWTAEVISTTKKNVYDHLTNRNWIMLKQDLINILFSVVVL